MSALFWLHVEIFWLIRPIGYISWIITVLWSASQQKVLQMIVAEWLWNTSLGCARGARCPVTSTQQCCCALLREVSCAQDYSDWLAVACPTAGTDGAGGPRKDQRGAEDCHEHPSCPWAHACRERARWWARWERSRSQCWAAVRGHHQGPQWRAADHWGREEWTGPETLEGKKLTAERVGIWGLLLFFLPLMQVESVTGI